MAVACPKAMDCSVASSASSSLPGALMSSAPRLPYTPALTLSSGAHSIAFLPHALNQHASGINTG